MTTQINSLWSGKGGVKEVLLVAIPLILSSGAHTVQTFIDRMFLTWYDRDAMSGAMLAGICNFCAVAFLMGLVGYINTFVAQYGGAGRLERIGPSIWQGLYIAILTGIMAIGMLFFAEPLFAFIGHSEKVQAYEVQYFKIMAFSILPALVSTAFSCFYAGRGETVVVMWINVFVCAVNLILDYLLIFGNFGFPRMGIEGAALATVIAIYSSVMIYAVMFFQRKYDVIFNTIRGWKPDWVLIKRILRYGTPNGINFMLDMITFTAFLAIVGKYDDVVQSATSMVFSVNMIAFMPVVGIGMAVSIVVGKYLGMDRAEYALRSAYVGIAIGVSFMLFISILYALFGKIFIMPFTIADKQAEDLMIIAQRMLYFVAIYSVADAVVIIVSSVLKGAGDTRFVMNVSFIGGAIFMVLPAYVAMRLNLSYYVPWFAITGFIMLLAVIFSLRFKGGKWKKMRVIETYTPEIEEINPVKDIAHL